MNLQAETFRFKFLTPCFSGTAEGKFADHAEMRLPPVRGHVRFWHRELFGWEDANHVWGSTNGSETQGSRIALRLLSGALRDDQPAHILPHDLRKSGKPRPSLPVESTYTLQLQRLVGCGAQDWSHAQRAAKLWLLLGCLGLRANRAAGSVWPLPSDAWPTPPSTRDELQRQLADLGCLWAVSLAGEAAAKQPRELRETASDTVNNLEHFGDAGRTRHPSPTRFKVIGLGEAYCLLVTAAHKPNGQSLLSGAYNLLKSKPRWQTLGPWQTLLP